jgi:hypothetical protein
MRRLPIRSAAPDVVYQKIQLPLNAFTHQSGALLSYEVVQVGFGELDLGSNFLDASEVRLDAIMVRW